MRRAWFIGGGAHTALGTDLAAAVGALEKISEPERVPLQYGDTLDEIPYRLLAGRPLERLEERLYDVLAGVIERALDEAAISADERLRMGLFLGSSSADVSVSEARFRRELAESDDAIALIASNSIANLALHLRRRFGLRGPDYSFNTACTASANALVTASDMIARGRIENALVVGVELFNVVTAAGFQSLGLLAPGNMRPFDRDRDGLTPGEGCSALVLSARQRSSDDLYLRGSATLCDTYSMSTTNPDGSTVATVIERALERAGVSSAEIAAIKVHGTASLHSDEAEAAGMQAVFDPVPPIFALKPHLGHTLGACGLNELLLFRAAMGQGVLPGTPGIASADRSDSGLALNQHNCDIGPGHFMLNYFGFGGNNTSLIVSNVD
jgi:3-oxoacyl-[acyl-carrier-protein] synthase-1